MFPSNTPQTNAAFQSRDTMQTNSRGPKDALIHTTALLWAALAPFLRSGRLQSMRDDSPDAQLSRLLLTVSPELPDLYVELFLDDDLSAEEEPDAEEAYEEDEPRLIGLVNWVGSEDAPVIFETDATRPESLPAEIIDAVCQLISPA